MKKFFLQALLIGAMIFGIGSADIQTASAAPLPPPAFGHRIAQPPPLPSASRKHKKHHHYPFASRSQSIPQPLPAPRGGIPLPPPPPPMYSR